MSDDGYNNDTIIDYDEDEEDDVIEEPVKKKRGRRPKVKSSDVPVVIQTFDSNNLSDVVKKKRGRRPSNKIFTTTKPVNVSANITPDCIMGNLPLTESEIKKIIGDKAMKEKQQKSELPSPMKRTESSFILQNDDDYHAKYKNKSTECEALKKEIDALKETLSKKSYLEENVSDNGMIEKKYYAVNKNFYDADNKCWPSCTKTKCWWCLHKFDTIPLGMPYSHNVKNNTFHMYGNFCSFNCAHAYNLNLGDYKIWERYALLIKIKKLIFSKSNPTLASKEIHAAKPREMLLSEKMTIDEFRGNMLCIPKTYHHNLPPAIPVYTVIEEIPKTISIHNQPTKKFARRVAKKAITRERADDLSKILSL
jgi:hypothetical protein